MSNFTTIPVAASGNSCSTEAGDPGVLITDEERNRWIAAGQFTTGSVGLTRSTSYSIKNNPLGGAPAVTVTPKLCTAKASLRAF